MELKQVWMSRDTQKQSRYSLRTLGGILGIAMLALVPVSYTHLTLPTKA